MGSADYATVSSFTSEFFERYSDMGYASFLLSFVYAETGILGLIEFNIIWVYLLYHGVSRIKAFKSESILVILCALSMIVTAFYNHTLRTNYGYIMWVFLGVVAVIGCREEGSELSGQSSK